MHLLGNGYDEGADGTVSEDRGSPGACTIQDRVDGGRVEPTAELENNNGEKV